MTFEGQFSFITVSFLKNICAVFFLLCKKTKKLYTPRWCKRLMFILAECNLAAAFGGRWRNSVISTKSADVCSCCCSVASIIQGYNNFSIEKSRSCILKYIMQFRAKSLRICGTTCKLCTQRIFGKERGNYGCVIGVILDFIRFIIHFSKRDSIFLGISITQTNTMLKSYLKMSHFTFFCQK